jgi:hypothetical protein
MGTCRHLLPLVLAVMALPAHPGEAPAPVHRTQALRTGDGQPRDRSSQAARPAQAQGPTAAQAGNSRPYRPSAPGEGAPKAVRD